MAAYLDEKMLTIEGYTAAELGLDADELATYVLEGLHAEASYAYAFDDGTASAYAEVTARSANELFWTLNDAFGEYLLDNDLWGRDAKMPDEAQREHIAAAAEQALASPGEPETYTYTFLLERGQRGVGRRRGRPRRDPRVDPRPVLRARQPAGRATA